MQNNLINGMEVGGLTMLVAGCSDNHYRVTDPTSGNAYYTTKVSDAGKGGAVKIKDEKTGSIDVAVFGGEGNFRRGVRGWTGGKSACQASSYSPRRVICRRLKHSCSPRVNSEGASNRACADTVSCW
jgi:hypothetical protein